MMQYKGYITHVDFNDEADIFWGEVINIRDVITFQGKTVEELRKAFEDSVEDYFAFCAERGEAAEEPFSGKLLVKLTPDQHRKVILAAEKQGKDVKDWAAEVLNNAANAPHI
jgi:predicted HicB family RNase H-like nuclease